MEFHLCSAVMFKRYRQFVEFADVDERLLRPFLATAAAFYVYSGKPLIVTSVLRTPGENVAVGGSPHSGHIDDPVRALDVRTGAVEDYPGLDEGEIRWVRDFWYRNFRRGRYWSCVVEADHLHFQVAARNGNGPARTGPSG